MTSNSSASRYNEVAFESVIEAHLLLAGFRSYRVLLVANKPP